MSSLGTPITLPPIPLLNSTSNTILYQQLKAKIEDEVKTLIPNFTSMRSDLGLQLWIINVVENSIPKSKNNKSSVPIDKKQLVLDILVDLFSFNPLEVTTASIFIEHALETDQVTKTKKSKGISYYGIKAFNIFKKVL